MKQTNICPWYFVVAPACKIPRFNDGMSSVVFIFDNSVVFMRIGLCWLLFVSRVNQVSLFRRKINVNRKRNIFSSGANEMLALFKSALHCSVIWSKVSLYFLICIISECPSRLEVIKWHFPLMLTFNLFFSTTRSYFFLFLFSNQIRVETRNQNLSTEPFSSSLSRMTWLL